MIKFTEISRVSDGLYLVASFEESEDEASLRPFREESKRMFRGPIRNMSPRTSVDTGSYVFHILQDDMKKVAYLTLCERSFPASTAFDYLAELQREFEQLYGADVERADRPYMFIKFDTFIHKTKRMFLESRVVSGGGSSSHQGGSSSAGGAIQAQLADVQKIMRKNIADVLGRGEKLETVSNMTQKLSWESRSYLDKAKEINRQAWLNKYGPMFVGGILILFFLIFFVIL
eukprot:ANDGO_05411.mRNA.1 25.3 kDa vesicle transport protein